MTRRQAALKASVHRTLPKRIRKLRGKRSQHAYAREIGIPQQNVNRWERGLVLPNAESLATLALHHGVSLDWLVFGRTR